MKQTIYPALVCAITCLLDIASAQGLAQERRGLPFLRNEDAQRLDFQATGIFQAIQPLADTVGAFAVDIVFNQDVVARGTLTKAGVITKWSEIKAMVNELSVVGADGISRRTQLKAIYADYDLAVLEHNIPLPEVKFPENLQIKPGSFLFAATADKTALGMGVVSVNPRSLREKDKAFLGVRMDFRPIEGGGVLLMGVEPDGAAARAGLLAGDVVTKINDKEVNGLLEMGNFLQSLKPGESVALTYRRQGQLFTVQTMLGARPEQQRIAPSRMRRMRQMGGDINEVSDGFPNVLQTDMQVNVTDVGSPVFDLDGSFVGIILARASRMNTYIIPADALQKLLEQKPDYLASTVSEPASSNTLDEAKRLEEVQKLRQVIEAANRRLQEIER